MTKQVSFSESMYGKNGELQIVKDGYTIAQRLGHPPKGKALLYAGIREMLEKGDRSNYYAFAEQAPELEEGIDGHSGASFGAVLWAAVQFLNGYTVKVGTHSLVEEDGTVTAL